MDFVNRVAELFGDLNLPHPFREGNGRVQRLFLEELARRCGYELDFSKVSFEEILESSIQSASGNLIPVQKMLLKSISDI